MPLKTGSSRKTVSSNIKELVDSYKSRGSIGSSKPKSKAAAVKQAVAISLKEAGMQKKAKGGVLSIPTSGAISVKGIGIQRKAKGGTVSTLSTSAMKQPKNIVSSQEKKIKARGGSIVFKRDGKLPVGIY
jgi:hypothetical protein